MYHGKRNISRARADLGPLRHALQRLADGCFARLQLVLQHACVHLKHSADEVMIQEFGFSCLGVLLLDVDGGGLLGCALSLQRAALQTGLARGEMPSMPHYAAQGHASCSAARLRGSKQQAAPKRHMWAAQ